MVGRREQGDGRTALEGIAEMRISQEARQGPGVALHEERDTGEGRALMENGRRGGGRGAGGGAPGAWADTTCRLHGKGGGAAKPESGEELTL